MTQGASTVSRLRAILSSVSETSREGPWAQEWPWAREMTAIPSQLCRRMPCGHERL